MAKVLVSPTGARIKGTLERLKGVALIHNINSSRKGEFTFEWAGETEVDWDSQETVTQPWFGLKSSGTRLAMLAAEIVFIDTDGDEWGPGDLTVVDTDSIEETDDV